MPVEKVPLSHVQDQTQGGGGGGGVGGGGVGGAAPGGSIDVSPPPPARRKGFPASRKATLIAKNQMRSGSGSGSGIRRAQLSSRRSGGHTGASATSTDLISSRPPLFAEGVVKAFFGSLTRTLVTGSHFIAILIVYHFVRDKWWYHWNWRFRRDSSALAGQLREQRYPKWLCWLVEHFLPSSTAGPLLVALIGYVVAWSLFYFDLYPDVAKISYWISFVALLLSYLIYRLRDPRSGY